MEKKLIETIRIIKKSFPKAKIIFATKYLNKDQFISFIQLAVELEISPLLIGENRVQDVQQKLDYLLKKAPELRKSFTYILIGHLQKNKINKAIQLFDEIHSVDSVALINILDNQLKKKEKKLKIFLEINIANDANKQGFNPQELAGIITGFQKYNNLTIEGVMTMPPYTENPESNRQYFRTLKGLADKYDLKTSMGTSQDWKIALEEETNFLRIGSKIFEE